MIKCEFCEKQLQIDPSYMKKNIFRQNMSFNDMMKGWWICQKCKPKLFGTVK